MSDPNLRCPARRRGRAAPAAPPTREVASSACRAAFRLGGAREAAGALPVSRAADDVVRVEFENGLRLWMRADDLLRERGRAPSPATDRAPWTIDPSPRPGLRQRDSAERGERGMVGLGIKVLEFFGVDLKQKSAALFGRAFEDASSRAARPGFTAAARAGAPAGRGGRRTADAAGRPPLLVFLHGTMSSLMGSFGDLWSGADDAGGQAALRRAQALLRALRHGCSTRSSTAR